ncbi:MAG: tyrosine-type recombinase/integrase [Alphaproteobacteria bacterium]|nr:tyrosine-type recombinase/integrase [Alphaproteobacteria bacterium]
MEKLTRWPYLYRHKNGTLYYLRRVPTDVGKLIRERQFRRSLKVRDERTSDAKSSYDATHRQIETFIADIRNGNGTERARIAYDRASALARRRGFTYRPMTDLVENATVDELIERLAAVEKKVVDRSDTEVDAIMGAVTEPVFTLSGALDRFIALSRNDLRGKNESQQRRWRNPLELAVRNFIDVVDDKGLADITRNNALAFRDWWVNDRIGKDVKTSNAANKELMHLRKIFRTVSDAHRLNLENPFSGLNITGDEKVRRLPISREHLETVMLREAALARLNSEARGIILAMADTGARINEVAGLEPNDILLDHTTPHIVIRANSLRSLKTRHSHRVIPLVGVALKTLLDNSKGFPRYAGKNASASSTINKFLRDNSLLPDGCTLYGLRHSFQDRLIEVEAPERIQADLMGHKTLRPKYGKGPSLEQMHEWLLKTALTPQN